MESYLNWNKRQLLRLLLLLRKCITWHRFCKFVRVMSICRSVSFSCTFKLFTFKQSTSVCLSVCLFFSSSKNKTKKSSTLYWSFCTVVYSFPSHPNIRKMLVIGSIKFTSIRFIFIQLYLCLSTISIRLYTLFIKTHWHVLMPVLAQIFVQFLFLFFFTLPANVSNFHFRFYVFFFFFKMCMHNMCARSVRCRRRRICKMQWGQY